MTLTKPHQSLEELNRSNHAAWLWDVVRARLVWANKPGLVAFEAESLFDLIDRAFDASEPAFATLAEAQRQLQRGQIISGDLDFPSLGRPTPFTCDCRLYTLADGREGILAVCHQTETTKPAADSLNMVEQFPFACLALDETGHIKQGNALAHKLLGNKFPPHLDDIFGEATAAQLLSRLKQTRLLSQISAYTGPFGPREARLTLSPLENLPGLHALLVMEDVTERRELERQLGLAKPKPAASDQQVFEHLGRTITKATAHNAAPLAPRKTAPEPRAKTNPTLGAQELQAILDTCTDGIVTLDAKGCILSFSSGAEAMFGWRADDVLGKHMDKILTPESTAVFKSYLATLNGPSLAHVFNDGREVEGLVKQGGKLPLSLTLGRMQQGSATFCAVLRDITAPKRNEGELRAAKEAAETASRHKSEFLANVSHEFKIPLTSIIGFSEIMREDRQGLAPNKVRGYANDIHTSATQLLGLVEKLLDIARAESGRMELDFTSVNLVDLVNAVINQLQPEALKAHVVIRKPMPDDLPHVVADQTAMHQVLANLISNAIKYTDAGGEVLVSARQREDGSLVLKVQDTGIGMDAEQLAKAKRPFTRIGTSGRERPGTGLGLPLAKALTEANRASFSISSEPAKGTAVEIIFPTTRVLAG